MIFSNNYTWEAIHPHEEFSLFFKGIPSQVAQAIQSAVNNAVQSMTSGAAGGRSLNIQPGHFEMSVSIDQNGQIISQSGPSRQNASSSGSTTTNNTASTSTTTSAGASSSSQSSGATATQTSRYEKC